MQFDKIKGLLSHRHKVDPAVEQAIQDSKSATQSLLNTAGNGYLYNWYVQDDVRGISGNEWVIPTDTDFFDLMEYLGNAVVNRANNSGGKLKQAGTENWETPNTGATNESGFNAIGSGIKSRGVFSNLKSVAVFWVSSVGTLPNGYGYALQLDYSSANATLADTPLKTDGCSIRLINRAPALADGETGFYEGNDGTMYPTICINGQEWMTVNLAETKYYNGDPIPTVTDSTEWQGLTDGAKCAYNNDETLVSLGMFKSLKSKVDSLFVNDSFTGICVLTQAEYDLLVVANQVNPTIIYLTK